MNDDQGAYFPQFMSMLKNNHLQGIRCIRSIDMTADEMLRATCAAACAYARMLQDDPKRREEFYQEAFPEGWKRFHKSKVLLHVLMYIKRAGKKGANYNVASAHSVALQHIFRDRKIADDDIPAYIKDHGGISGLLNEGKACGVAGNIEIPIVAVEDDTAHENLPRRAKTMPSTRFNDATLSGAVEADGEADPFAEDDQSVSRPARKAAKPETEEPDLKLLPRSEVANYILVRHHDLAKNRETLRALDDGKKVKVELSKGKTSNYYELYKGAGNFFDILIEDEWS